MNVFVYGTLKTGGGIWAHTLAPAKGIPDKVFGYNMFDLGMFPAVVKANNERNVVHGETFLDINDELLAELDRIEGVPNMYSRARVTTAAGYECFIYIMPQAPTRGTRIYDGIWRGQKAVAK